MDAVLELKEIQGTSPLINPELNKYEKRTPSKKLQEANETLERYPPPAKSLLKKYSEIEKQQGIHIAGIVKRINAETDTFTILIMDGHYEIHYHIRTSPETLNNIIKTYWDKEINVQIRPQINESNQFEYELMQIN
jgi:hypothetical protein